DRGAVPAAACWEHPRKHTLAGTMMMPPPIPPTPDATPATSPMATPITAPNRSDGWAPTSGWPETTIRMPASTTIAPNTILRACGERRCIRWAPTVDPSIPPTPRARPTVQATSPPIAKRTTPEMAISTMAASEVAWARCWLKRSIPVISGTITMPPPTPNVPLRTPARTPTSARDHHEAAEFDSASIRLSATTDTHRPDEDQGHDGNHGGVHPKRRPEASHIGDPAKERRTDEQAEISHGPECPQGDTTVRRGHRVGGERRRRRP